MENLIEGLSLIMFEQFAENDRLETDIKRNLGGGRDMSFEESVSLPDGWQIMTVDQLVSSGALAKPLDGNHGSIHPKASDYVEQGIPFVMASDLQGGQVDLSNCKFISEVQANSLRKGFAQAGDVLLSHKATIGRTAIVQGSEYPFLMLTPQVTYYRVLDSQQLVPNYLKAYFDSHFFQSILALWAGSGSTRAYLGITGQLKLPIIVPPIAFQKLVAGQAETLNDKIQLNHQINQTLEQMAQAIFKSWFADFEPVKAKIAALEAGGSDEDALLAAMQAISGKDEAELTRLQAEQPEQCAELYATAELFPSAMQDSELGEIPEGWSAGTLSNIANLNKQSWTRRTIPSEIVYVDLANTKNGTIESTTTYTSDDAPSRARRILSDGDTIVGTVRPGNRSFAFIKQPQTTLTGSTGFAVLSPKQVELAEFVYITATSDESITYLAHLADGGAYPAVRPEVVANFPCVLPPERLIAHFHMRVRPFFDQTAVNKQEASTLSELRDSLLPKLLSGELDVACEDDQIAEAMEPADV